MTQALINVDGRVLAAVDASVYAASVADHAAWAARRTAAPLELLHTLERTPAPWSGDLSGNLRADDREDLLASLTTLDEQRGRLAHEHGKRLLAELVSRIGAADASVQPTIRQRHGSLVETLLELEADVRLFVIGKRGEHADFARGHLGSNLERVIRAVHRPVLVASRAFRPIRRFLIAFDGSPTTRKCVELVCISPLLKGLQCGVLMAGAASGEARAQLEWARARLAEAGFEPAVLNRPGSPDTVIAEHVGGNDIDLLIMGAYGHSRIRTMIIGSTTTQVLRACLVPVLLLR